MRRSSRARILVAPLRTGGRERARKATTSTAVPAMPRTHAELDALAIAHGVEFPDDVSTVADKQAALRAAGVTA